MDSTEAAEVIRQALASRHSAVIARAAALVGDMGLQDIEPELRASYGRLSAEPEKLDPVCAAMKEVVGALFSFATEASDVYLHAARHVQIAGWDNQDVGAPLRGIAVQALVKTEHPAALTLATDMLMDGLPPAPDRDDGLTSRIGAAKALRALGSEASAHVLRLKVLAGDPSIEVYGECFAGMLEYSPAWLDAVAAFLTHENDVLASMAALAIAESRPPGALDHLKQAWETQTNPETREAIINAIASLRSDEAVSFLIDLVKGESMTALQAMSGLTLYAASESVMSQVRAAAKANNRREVYAMFQRLFG
jgi:HEAT repeat protein